MKCLAKKYLGQQKCWSKYSDPNKNICKQAGAQLCQAQVKLEVVVEVVLEVGFEIGVEVCPDVGGWVGWRLGLNDNTAILNSVDVVVEVELGKNCKCNCKAIFNFKVFLIFYKGCRVSMVALYMPSQATKNR